MIKSRPSSQYPPEHFIFLSMRLIESAKRKSSLPSVDHLRLFTVRTSISSHKYRRVLSSNIPAEHDVSLTKSIDSRRRNCPFPPITFLPRTHSKKPVPPPTILLPPAWENVLNSPPTSTHTSVLLPKKQPMFFRFPFFLLTPEQVAF